MAEPAFEHRGRIAGTSAEAVMARMRLNPPPSTGLASPDMDARGSRR